MSFFFLIEIVVVFLSNVVFALRKIVAGMFHPGLCPFRAECGIIGFLQVIRRSLPRIPFEIDAIIPKCVAPWIDSIQSNYSSPHSQCSITARYRSVVPRLTMGMTNILPRLKHYSFPNIRLAHSHVPDNCSRFRFRELPTFSGTADADDLKARTTQEHLT